VEVLMIINDKQVEILQHARMLWDELQQLRADLKGKRNGDLKSPALDGMPRSSSNADKMVERLIQIESLERREAFLVRSVSEARVRARYVCRSIRSSIKLRLFCEAYCVDMQPVETAQKISGVDDQTVRTYLKLLGEAQ
jgi:hypothetical protein